MGEHVAQGPVTARRRALAVGVALAVGIGLATGGAAVHAAVSATEPPWTSAQKAGGTGSDDGNAVAVTGTGAPLIAGNFSGTSYFSKSSAADDSIALSTRDDSQDVYVAGMNGASTYFTWALRAGGPGTSNAYGTAVMGTDTASTVDDTAIVTGSFDGTMYFPKSSTADDSIALTATGSRDLFVAALRPGGNYFAWAVRAGSSSASDVTVGNSVALTGDDTAVIAGYFTGTVTFPKASGSISLTATGGQDMFLAAVGPSGAGFSWAQRAGGTSLLGDSLAIMGTSTPTSTDDTTIIVGSMIGAATFPTGRAAPDDSITLTPIGSNPNVFIAAMNADDTYFAWAQAVGGGIATYSGEVAILGDDTPILVGNFGDTAYFRKSATADDSFALTSSPGTQDVFVAALRPRSKYFAWAQQAGGTGEDWGLGIAVTPDDTAIITGYFDGSASFPTGGTPITLSAVPVSTYLFVAALRANGTTFGWAQGAGGTATDELRGLGVAAAGDDTAIVVGNLKGTANFPLTLGSITLQSRGSQDAFVASMVTASGGAPAPDPGPTPGPVYPPSAPTDVRAVAGDASAAVTWKAPSSPGSYPVTYYKVSSSPPGGSCLVPAPALECTVTGLRGGTAYTFTVEALNGAGWSASSDPSNEVLIPAPVSILITGSRSGPKVVVAGTSKGLGLGAILRPWTKRGEGSFTEGTSSILVSGTGTFTWERRARGTISVYVATPDGSARSNTAVIRAR